MNNGAIDIGGIEASLKIDSGQVPEGLAHARKAMSAIGDEINHLKRDLDAGSIGILAFNARMQELTRTQNALSASMQTAYSSLGTAGNGLDIFNKQAQTGMTAASRMGQSLLQLGYIADDLRYGFSAIVNNIGPLVMNLSGNAGLAGAAQVAAVASIQLYESWDHVKEAFGDDSSMREAMKSLEGMSERLKTLKADAAGFSFGDKVAFALGYNPDAGKGQDAANLEKTIKAKTQNEKNAAKMDDDHTPEQKEAAKHFEDAIKETGGTEKHAGTLAEDMLKKQGPASFLSQEKTAGAGLNPMGTLGTAARALGMTGESEADTHARLSAKNDRNDEENSRLGDLNFKAKQAAEAKARDQIGAAMYDKTAQAGIAERLGGKAGDTITGKEKTEKERLDQAKQWQKDNDFDHDEGKKSRKTEDQAEKDQRAEDKRNREERKDVASKLVPDIKAMADRAALAVDHGADPTKARAILANSLHKDGNGLTEEDASQTGGDLLSDAMKGTPLERAQKEKMRVRHEENEAKRADRELNDEANKASPGIDQFAQSAIANAEMQGPTRGRRMKGDKGTPVYRGTGSNRRQTGRKFTPMGAEMTAAMAKKQIEARLEAGGLKGEKLKQATEMKFEEGKHELSKKINEKMFGVNAKMATRQANSEMYGTASLTSKIQSSVGTSGPNAKSETLLQQIVDELKREAGQTMVFKRKS